MTGIGAYLYQATGKANPHAATSVGGTTYAYDDNGNLTSDSTWTHGWNYDNTLKQSVNGGTTVSYGYDHSGQRVKLVSGGTTTRYPNKFYNTDGTKNTRHIYAGDTVVATIENNTLYYDHTDHLSGSNALTNTSGSLIQLMDYYPYGNMRIDWKFGTFDEQRKFTGHEFDRATNLTYANARYYKQGVGRWMSQDPIARDNPVKFLSDPQQLNYYAYSRNNPLRFIDPLGLFNKDTGEIESGDTLSAITNTLNKTYGINLTVNGVATVNGIEDPNKIYSGNFITLPKTNLELHFDNKSLQAFDQNYGIGYENLKWEAVSGGTGLNFAPISEGQWRTVDPSEIQYWDNATSFNKFMSNVSKITKFIGLKGGMFPGGTSSWGTQRTELNNVDTGTNNTGYYIHGGSSPGSAGCIDLTNQNDSFHDWFRSYGKPVNVIVNY